MHQQTYSLSQLNACVAETIRQALPDKYLLCAEAAEVREVRGHCYIELVEKDEDSNTPIAKASARCWSSTWQAQRTAFTQATGQNICPGMKLLMTVYPQFHPAYGFSWIITDIHPEYTIGELARRRTLIIKRLKEMGVYDLQHQLQLPRFCQRIAVVSAEGAAGYGDFIDQLHNNPYGLAFTTEIFPAVMQGEQVESSVIAALNKINERIADFDCIIIIRGGGATADMSGFDTFNLAENVANFPLPVITGIGHERDECVLDMIACVKMKTPTAVAAFLIDHLLQTKTLVEDLKERMLHTVAERINLEQIRLRRFSDSLPTVVKLCLQQKRHRLDLLKTRVTAADPALTLRRGFAIVRKNGQTVKDSNAVGQGDNICITLSNGNIAAVVK